MKNRLYTMLYIIYYNISSIIKILLSNVIFINDYISSSRIVTLTKQSKMVMELLSHDTLIQNWYKFLLQNISF